MTLQEIKSQVENIYGSHNHGWCFMISRGKKTYSVESTEEFKDIHNSIGIFITTCNQRWFQAGNKVLSFGVEQSF